MITVLIVEDNEDKSQAITDALVDSQVVKSAVEIATNVRAALRLMEERHFDILILDLQLPMRANTSSDNNGGRNLLKTLRHDFKKVEQKYKLPSIIIGLTQHPDLFKSQTEFFNEQRVFAYQYDAGSNDWRRSIDITIKEYATSQAAKVDKTSQINIIYSIHGIMTLGDWQNDLDELLELNADYKHIKFKYNFFPFIPFLIPKMRQKEVERFKKEMGDLMNRYPRAEVSVISHSFGTYILATALQQMEVINCPNYSRLILCGSVLRADFAWSDIVNKHSLKGVLNECAIADKALLCSYFFAAGLGKGGRDGFKNTVANTITNRYHNGGHSTFFRNKTFKEWIKYIVNGEMQEFDQRKDLGVIGVIKNVLLSHRKISLLAFACTVLLLFLR